jgi:hypothetical protein
MNHGFKLHPDGTLEITMPKGKKVGRVLVCEEGTQNGALYYPESDVKIKPISYTDCSNAMLKMWIDDVLTDGEYNKIMDKLNAKHGGE